VADWYYGADLAVGSGILSRRVVDEGCEAFGVDLSLSMLRIARTVVPEATLVQAY
jgi:ubiquinone/menaquinone biosynthesis C-methylase UbiE